MSQYDAEMQQAIRLAVFAKLPLTAATIVVVHVLPTLFVWGLPELRRGIVYAAWIALTTIGAGNPDHDGRSGRSEGRDEDILVTLVVWDFNGIQPSCGMRDRLRAQSPSRLI
jgi:hypothetical protein